MAAVADAGWRRIWLLASSISVLVRFCARSLVVRSAKDALRGGRLRILYVDTMSMPMAKANTRGLARAYARVADVRTFDYHGQTGLVGPVLMNWLLEREAQSFRPDIVHLGKCESVDAAAIVRIRANTGARVLYFYGDIREEIQPYVVCIGRVADQTLMQHEDPSTTAAYLQQGVRRIRPYRCGVDAEVFRPYSVKKLYDIVFMANNPPREGQERIPGAEERRAFVRELALAPWQLDVFGSGWEELEGLGRIRLHGFVGGAAFAQACSAARITLGFGTNSLRLCTSWPRPLRCMASGAFHLTRYFAGLEVVFEKGKHLDWFHSTEEAVSKIDYYLRNEGERDRIAASGREEVLRHHTWDQRVTTILAGADLPNLAT